MSRAGRAGSLPEANNLRLRRDTIVTVLALLAIAITIPFAILDTFQMGRVYVFSRQFIEELPQRFTGPGRFRFILQPMTAILLGLRGGLRDTKAGHILPTCAAWSSVLNSEESCCAAEWPASATCSPSE